MVSPFFALFPLNPAAIRAHDRKVYDLIAEAEAEAAAAAPRGAQPADAEVAESVDLFGATLILKVDGLDRARPVGQQVDRLPPHLFAGFAADGEVERGGVGVGLVLARRLLERGEVGGHGGHAAAPEQAQARVVQREQRDF